jgi:hypothetical protein
VQEGPVVGLGNAPPLPTMPKSLATAAQDAAEAASPLLASPPRNRARTPSPRRSPSRLPLRKSTPRRQKPWTPSGAPQGSETDGSTVKFASTRAVLPGTCTALPLWTPWNFSLPFQRAPRASWCPPGRSYPRVRWFEMVPVEQSDTAVIEAQQAMPGVDAM